MPEQAQPAERQYRFRKSAGQDWKAGFAGQVADACLPPAPIGAGSIMPIGADSFAPAGAASSTSEIFLHPKEERTCDGATD